jgi:opacity protein-like surface antigen
LKRRSLFCRVSVVALLVACVAAPVWAAETVEKKWRLGFSLGGQTPQDEIPSDAANILSLFARDFTLEQIFLDPRDDSSVFGTLEFKPSGVGFLSAQYGVSSMFILEGSVGYANTDLGAVEVQAQFDNIPVDENIGFNFKTYRIDAGEVEMVPIMLSGLVRFRPRANFNPYLGAGIGYQLVGYKPSAEFDQLSINMDNSLGALATLSGAVSGNPSLTRPRSDEVADLQGANVEAGDSFIYQFILGGEWTIKGNWALLLDLRYSFSSRSAKIGFNGGTDLGIAVPFLTDYIDSPVAQQTFGAMSISTGGLVDGGSLVPGPGATGNTSDPNYCVNSPGSCIFDPTQKDGVVDTGLYYVTGGEVDYSSFWFTIGARYTF